SLLHTVKKVLVSLELRERQYQQRINRKEEKLLANDLHISKRLRSIRTKIEQEEIQKSLMEVKKARKTHNQASLIMIVFGIACIVTILIFVVMIIRDTRKSNR